MGGDKQKKKINKNLRQNPCAKKSLRAWSFQSKFQFFNVDLACEKIEQRRTSISTLPSGMELP